jgi:hypothetical protein
MYTQACRAAAAATIKPQWQINRKRDAKWLVGFYSSPDWLSE